MKYRAIDTLLIDLGGVLVHFDKEAMLAHMAQTLSLDHKQMQLWMDRYGVLYETGHISPADLEKHIERETSKKTNLTALMAAHPSIFRLNEEMACLLEELKKQHFRLIVLSNTSETHCNYLRKTFHFDALFDDYILSYEIQAMKPDPLIYEAALQKSQRSPDACFYIDDIDTFIQAAAKLGILGHCFTDVKGCRKALCSHGLLPS